jgi:acyl-coenzyme A synthetase/AMP-(fatty) acid ligase
MGHSHMIPMGISAAVAPLVGRQSLMLPDTSVASFPLMAHTHLEQCVARRNGETFTVQQFLTSALELASRLPAKRYAINLCRDRYHFLIAFAAALISRQISLLPNCRAPEVVTQLKDRYPEAFVLADHNDIPSDIPLYRVPEWAPRLAPRIDIPLIPVEQMAAIVFTSGSSGLPEAHAKTWSALVRGAQALIRQFGIREACSRVVVGTVSPQHMYGLETTIMLPLQAGWSIHTGHPFLPADTTEALRNISRPVWLMTTPIHLRAYVGDRTALPDLERIISATMPLSRSMATKAEDLWNVPVHEIYGCTEGGAIGSRRTTATHKWTPCPGLQLRQDGDVAWVSGGHVGLALRLADRITVQSHTQFILHGPRNDLVKVAGKRTSLAGLNATLARIDGVMDGTFYRPHLGRSMDRRLTAFVVAPGMSASAIQRELKKRIDPVFLPRPLHLVEALPRNSTGKLPRERLGAFAREITARHRSGQIER